MVSLFSFYTALRDDMSAQVEEVNAAAQSLAEMASTLQRIVAEFRLNEKGGL
jgi:methyl-accepting chemotaxis protein